MILAYGGHREMRKEESRVLKDISEDINLLLKDRKEGKV